MKISINNKLKILITLLLFVVCIIIGCAHPVTEVFINRIIDEPKIIAIRAPREPWVAQIESRLRQNGFKVLRWASQKTVRDQTSTTRSEEFNEASTRYVLEIHANTYLDPMNRCFGGGYKFEFISADLVDTKSNEIIVNYSNSGYSEGCPPASGTIFQDITDTVSNRWKKNDSN